MRVIISNFITLLTLCESSKLLLPVCDKTAKWNSITLKPSLCPSPNQIPDLSNLKTITIQIINPKSLEQRHQGYICKKIILRTSCTSSWIFKDEIGRTVIEIKPTAEDCLQKLKAEELNIFETEFALFPNPNCPGSLLSKTNNVDNIITKIQAYTVLYDPYTLAYIDRLFPQGNCKTQICLTTSPLVIWITNQTPNCLSPKTILADLAETVKGQYLLTGPDLPIINLTNLCHSNYCGHPGYETPHGFFLSGINLSPYISNKKCSQTHVVETLAGSFKEDRAITYLTQELEEIRCKQYVETLSINNSIMIKDLHHLQPFTPGWYPVYRVSPSGLLEKTVCEYKYLSRHPSDNQHIDYLGTTENNIKVYWNHWIPIFQNQTTCPAQGPNGITRDNNCKFRIPLQLDSYFSGTSFGDYYVEIKHPSSQTTEETNILSVLSEDLPNQNSNYNMSDIMYLIGDWIEEYKLLLKITLLISCIISVGLLTCKCKSSCRFNKRKPGLKINNSSEVFEMLAFQP